MQSDECRVPNEQIRRRILFWFLNFAICALHSAIFTALPARAADPIEADILLSGGSLFDGAGSDGEIGDVAIQNDRIVGVGKFELKSAKWTIDCKDLIVAPGFIDLHNHSDSQIVVPKTRANVNFLMQGCTTIVTGNCGSGPIEVGAYYSKIDAAGAGTNVAHLLPQGGLRGNVVGSVQRSASSAEIARMRDLADKAMREGAWGMSTGLIYVPSSYADTGELIEVAKVVGKHRGLYVSHIRGEGKDLLESVQEAIKIGRDSDCPIHISHFKASGEEAWGLVRPAAAMIDAARKDGLKVTADQYPYIASSTSLDATLLPTWALAGGRSKLVERLNDNEQGERIREFIAKRLDKSRNGATVKIAAYSSQPAWAGHSLAEIAAKEKRPPLEIVLAIVRNGGAGVVNFGMSEEDVRFVMQQPWVATASDGRAYLPANDKPHPRNYGTFPRKLGEYALKEKIVSLTAAIRSSTSLPAQILGLEDRGSLKAGNFADIVVFDPKTLRDTATFDDPHQYATGMKFVFVNGDIAVKNGEATGVLAGRALKRKSAN